MRVLGVNTAHDSSVCLVEDGKVIAYWKEERLTGNKKDTDPIVATQKILEGIDGVDIIAYGDPTTGDYIHRYLKILKKYINFYDVIDFSNDHHLQHASLGFYNSGFSEASVIVIDRNGTILNDAARESESIFHATYPSSFKPVYKNYWVFENTAHEYFRQYKKEKPEVEIEAKSFYGIVKVYESATSLIQQHVLENGKTMGLSAYGDKSVEFPDLFVNGTNIPNDHLFGHEVNDGETHETVYLDLTELKNKSFTRHNVKIYADYAWHVQKQTQEAVCHLIKKAVEKTGSKNIVITGGYGLNVVANGYYLEQFPDLNFYFEPLADDTGNSIGSALLAYRIASKDKNIYPIEHTFYHGKEYDVSDISGTECGVLNVADLLSTGKSVAVFKGKAEAGPRALGNRSILFDPRNPNAVEIVNKIKNREWYRPFACMVLEEDAHLYFNMNGQTKNKFMTVSFSATDLAKEKIPGVLHVDGSCRIQTIDTSDGIVYDLLKKFREMTGVGVLLNTSFNLAGAPLVETPKDALLTLENSPLDYVWFADGNILRGK